MHRGWPATAIPGGRDSGGRRGVGGRLGGGSWMGMLRAGSFVPRDVWPVRGRRLLSESWSCVWAWALPAVCTFLSGEGWARHLSDATDGVLGFLCSGFPDLRPVRIRPCGRRPEGAVLLRPRPCAHLALCSSSPVPHQCRCLIQPGPGLVNGFWGERQETAVQMASLSPVTFRRGTAPRESRRRRWDRRWRHRSTHPSTPRGERRCAANRDR